MVDLAEDAVTIFICVTPSYKHWLDNKVNAVGTAKVQTYEPVDINVLTFDDGTKVWDMYQQCLDICGTPYYAIIGVDDFLGPEYIEYSMQGILEYPQERSNFIDEITVRVAAGSTCAWLISDEVIENEQVGIYDGWVAGVWNTEVARDLGGYRKPSHGGVHGCGAELAARAGAAGFKCALATPRQYYYRIWSGSVSKPDPKIEERIRDRKEDQLLTLGVMEGCRPHRLR